MLASANGGEFVGFAKLQLPAVAGLLDASSDRSMYRMKDSISLNELQVSVNGPPGAAGWEVNSRVVVPQHVRMRFTK